jgi:predicted glycosyltransferase
MTPRPEPIEKPLNYPHDHNFLSSHQHRNERRTWIVIALTVATMSVEIAAGLVFGSMALLADGWHMASHASALGITALAYYLARKHRCNTRFTFGTGKIGELAGFTSALLLAIVALSARNGMNPAHLRKRLCDIHHLEHVTIEINPSKNVKPWPTADSPRNHENA